MTERITFFTEPSVLLQGFSFYYQSKLLFSYFMLHYSFFIRSSGPHGDVHPEIGNLHPKRRQRASSAGQIIQSYLLCNSYVSVHPSIYILTASSCLPSPFLLQKMLDYLKEKRDAGFFKSLSGLMQSCRYWYIKCNYCVGIKCLYLTFEFFLFLVSWIWMHLRGKTKQKDLAWWQRKVQVS